MSKFWTGGGGAYAKALREECAATVRALGERLGSTGSKEEKARIRSEIRSAKANLREKLAKAEKHLF
jgi:hypothetical protein